MSLMLWMLRREEREEGDDERDGGEEVEGEVCEERQWKGPYRPKGPFAR